MQLTGKLNINKI